MNLRFIPGSVHGILDYAVAVTLIVVPVVLGFNATSPVAFWLPVAGGLGLFVYSLLTGYSRGLRNMIPYRVHLGLDFVAALALIVAPLLFGFSGVPQIFLTAVGAAVIAVVALSDPAVE